MKRRPITAECAFLIAVYLLAFWNGLYAQTAPPNMDAVLARMEAHEQMQATRIASYRSRRHYSVDYKGFQKQIHASMDVDVLYRAGSGKSFLVVSQTGSRLLLQKVLSRALDSEREASLNPAASALNRIHYRFKFVAYAAENGRELLVLDVEPLAASKFLYSGRVWVDTSSYAVVKMEVQPVKNPSFLISHTTIHHENAPTHGVWLPLRNQSHSSIRLGGTAVMTIDYGEYQVEFSTFGENHGTEVKKFSTAASNTTGRARS